MNKQNGILRQLLESIAGPDRTDRLFRVLVIHPDLASDPGPRASRAVLAQALNMLLFEDLLKRVPAAETYVQHSIAIWVPIWDTAGGGGSGGSYHIVGFGAVIFTGQDTQHGRWLTGAAVSGVGCPGNGNTQVTGYAGSVCSAPGGAIALGATGSVRLIH